MASSLKIIFRKNKKDEPLGYLFLQKIENRKSNLLSLGLPPFDVRHWNERKQRVKKTSKVDYELYNQTIEDFTAEVLKDSKSFNTNGATDKRSYLKYFELELSRPRLADKHGTRLKYQTVFKKLNRFLSSKNKDDLRFSDLSRDFLDEFRLFMKKSGMEANTANHYLKILKVIYGKAEQEYDMAMVKNPFYRYKFERKKPKQKETLYREDIHQLQNASLEGKPRLSRARDLFLFQFFTGGMRVSDLVTLRYNNLKGARVRYNMFKTENAVDSPITEAVLVFLRRLLELPYDLDDPVERLANIDELKDKRKNTVLGHRYGDKVLEIKGSPYSFSDEVFDNIPLSITVDKSYYLNSLGFVNSLTGQQLQDEKAALSQFIEKEGYIEVNDVNYDFNSLFAQSSMGYQGMLHSINKRINYLRKTYLESTFEELNNRGDDKETSTHFVFGMLKESDFKNIDAKNDFSLVDEEQYKKVNKAGILYNRHLKQLGHEIGLSKTLHTHLPRTSFANIMMGTSANHMDISKALGHSSLSVTDEYLNTGFNNGRIDEVLQGLGAQFG